MIIGITGKAGAGKDTVADYLVKNHGYTKLSLADPIRRIVQDVFVLSHFQVWNREEREKPLPQWNNWTVRKLLQIIGSEGIRDNVDPEVWVKHVWFKIEKELEINPNLKFVIPDVRFPNELKYFQDHVPAKNFECWKIIRKGYSGNVGVSGHVTESYDLKGDYTLTNNGTFEELYKQVEKYIA